METLSALVVIAIMVYYIIADLYAFYKDITNSDEKFF